MGKVIARIQQKSAIAVHNNADVLRDLTSILDNVPIKFKALMGDERNLASRSTGKDLYFLQFDHSRPGGGVEQYARSLTPGSDVVLVAEKAPSATELMAIKNLPSDKMFYGYLYPHRLKNPDYADFLRKLVSHLMFDTPRNTLLFCPEGYGRVKGWLADQFSLKGWDTHIETASSLQSALRKASLNNYYDRMYIPGSFLPDLHGFTDRSLAWPFLVSRHYTSMVHVIPDATFNKNFLRHK